MQWRGRGKRSFRLRRFLASIAFGAMGPSYKTVASIAIDGVWRRRPMPRDGQIVLADPRP